MAHELGYDVARDTPQGERDTVVMAEGMCRCEPRWQRTAISSAMESIDIFEVSRASFLARVGEYPATFSFVTPCQIGSTTTRPSSASRAARASSSRWAHVVSLASTAWLITTTPKRACERPSSIFRVRTSPTRILGTVEPYTQASGREGGGEGIGDSGLVVTGVAQENFELVPVLVVRP